MIKQMLDKKWIYRQCGENRYREAVVPGSLYADHLRNGVIEDPFWRDNEEKALALMEYDYEYQTSFKADAELFSASNVRLHFDGLDTLADIYLNEVWLGSADNMHRIWEYSVLPLLKKEENLLRIEFHSPVKFIAKAYQECECDGSPECMEGFPHLRKAHCMFGWDWGPRLPDMGIWRMVSLFGVETARIASVFLVQDHREDEAEIAITPEIIGGVGEDNSIFLDISVFSPDGAKIAERKECGREEQNIVIPAPRLWWPNGYGEQNLYRVEVILYADGYAVDQWNRKIGLRTMTVHREEDAYGESFAHEVNGMQIFAMGADYIPEDSIFGRMSKERTGELLTHCKECNFNVIRVWGGGFYPDDYFYDLCDELGLVVWQDFMFACAVYDLNDAFVENIKQEITDNVKRIRHHACLGLWCGNNEMEMFISNGQWIKREKQKADYLVMNEYIIPKLLKKLDPNTFYWPSSPSSGGSFYAPNEESLGDVHYWEVWHGGAPFTDFRKYYFRYLSEFGFQSFPCLSTIKSFTEEEDRNIFSYVMEKHQRNHAANGKILKYLSETFLYPDSFEGVIYTSQLLQAEAIRYGVEHLRRHRGRCMGAVYWQLNDCWQAASWSSIDYCGRWKALQYYAKRFFAPLLLSCEEEGMLTQNTNVNAEHHKITKSAALCLSNETVKEQEAQIKWALRSADSAILEEGEFRVTAGALSSVWMDRLTFSDADERKHYFSFELWQEDTLVSEGMVLFGIPKYYQFLDSKLTYSVDDDSITVTSQAFVKGVEIMNASGDLLLSDNYFDMNAGTKKVKIIKGSKDGLEVKGYS